MVCPLYFPREVDHNSKHSIHKSSEKPYSFTKLLASLYISVSVISTLVFIVLNTLESNITDIINILLLYSNSGYKSFSRALKLLLFFKQ